MIISGFVYKGKIMNEIYEIVRVEKNHRHLIGRFNNKEQAKKLHNEILEFYKNSKQQGNIEFKVLEIISEDVSIMRFCAHASMLSIGIVKIVEVCPFVEDSQNSPCCEEYIMRARQNECILGVFCYGSTEEEACNKIENVISTLKAENLLQSAIKTAHQQLNIPYK